MAHKATRFRLRGEVVIGRKETPHRMDNPFQQPRPEIVFTGRNVPQKNLALRWAKAFVWLSPMGASILTLAVLFLFRRPLGEFDGMTVLGSALGLNVLFAGGAGVCEAFLQGRKTPREILGVAFGFLVLQTMFIGAVLGVIDRFFRV